MTVAFETSEHHVLNLTLPSDPAGFGTARERLDAFLAQYLEESAAIADVIVAVDEALTNAALHSCEGRTDLPLHVHVAVVSPRAGARRILRITIIDYGQQGRAFQPAEQLAESQARAERGEQTGFGLLLIHRLMDGVAYRSTDDGAHRLVMHKIFTGGAWAASGGLQDATLRAGRRCADDAPLRA